MTSPNGSYDGTGRPPTGAFPVYHRLLRGYGPVLVLVLAIALVAAFVPSRVPKSNAASVGSNGALSASNSGQSTGAGAGSGGGGGTSHSGQIASSSGGTSGSKGSAGHTVVTPGKVLACSGKQIPADPYSPPCEQFSGFNGASTFRGVSGNTITLTARLTSDQSFQQTLAQLAGAQLADTNADNERTIKALIEYFNTHFQFYGRKFVVKFYNGQGSLANELQGYGQAQAQADAATAKSLGSFADITAESEPYATALWKDGVMGFGDPYMPLFWHQDHAPYDWSLATDGTKVATEAANYAVQKLCPSGSPATFAGGNLKNKPRVFAGIAPENELYKVSASVFTQIMGGHGCNPKQYYYALDLGTESQQAANLVAQLKSAGVTTIVCGCDPIFPVYLSGQAAQQNYFPEFEEIGAALVDQDYVGQLYNQQFYSHAFGISPNAQSVPYSQTLGYAAYEAGCQADPTICNGQGPAFFVNIIYSQMDMLAIGAQMAGPDLTASSFQQGMFNYPPRQGPAGLWGWSSTQYTIPNNIREVCWSPTAISPYNNKQGAYVNHDGEQFWTINQIPKGPPDCPVPS